MVRAGTPTASDSSCSVIDEFQADVILGQKYDTVKKCYYDVLLGPLTILFPVGWSHGWMHPDGVCNVRLNLVTWLASRELYNLMFPGDVFGHAPREPNNYDPTDQRERERALSR